MAWKLFNKRLNFLYKYQYRAEDRSTCYKRSVSSWSSILFGLRSSQWSHNTEANEGTLFVFNAIVIVQLFTYLITGMFS